MMMMPRSSLLWILLCVVVPLMAQDPPPANDVCDGAIDLTVLLGNNDEVGLEGSTVSATKEENQNLCGATAASKRGIWYLYKNSSIPEDSSTIVTVSTCHDDTDFDTALTVYEGFCTGLQCVHGVDNDTECSTGSGQHSTLSWHAKTGTRYYLLVHGGHVNHTGKFSLTVTTEEPLAPPSPQTGSDASSSFLASPFVMPSTIMILGAFVSSLL
ncbi:expressed unknown protein [Seminavis robusta]|uniref:Uncharacterized protein n=1 Tax=Seminavis robusta TaxID=568900 RepID=A0A9N8EVK7_9STRA|nr:expressed unknown protein [Seminavis robusta]|eukprot:Sro1817_g299520.1 n/a (213) ;mRNA; r:7093-7828